MAKAEQKEDLPPCFFVPNQDCPKECEVHNLSRYDFQQRYVNLGFSPEHIKSINRQLSFEIIHAIAELRMEDALDFPVSPRSCKNLKKWLNSVSGR